LFAAAQIAAVVHYRPRLGSRVRGAGSGREHAVGAQEIRGTVVPELIIDDSTGSDRLFNVVINGERKGRGHDPSQVRRFMFDPPSAMPVIPRSEWSDRIKQKIATKSQISDRLLRDGIPSLDQGPVGYCWAHSTTGAVQAQRALAGQPYVPLSAYAIAATIKHGRRRGRLVRPVCAVRPREGHPVSVAVAAGRPQLPQYDRPEVWENAALHKTTKSGWT
jgi:hypothetical protein